MIPALAPEAQHIVAKARVVRTPVSGGGMVWRIWGDGPPVVLLHGGFGGWMHWVRNVAPLAASHTVLVPDLPGAGESAVDDAPDMDAFSATVARGLHALGVTGAFDLAGFSFGSSVALHMPPPVRERVGRLILVGSAAIGPFVPVRTLDKWRGVADPAERARIHAANLGRMMLWNPAAIDEQAIAIHMRNVESWRLRMRQISPTGRSAERLTAWNPGHLDLVWGRQDVIVRTCFDPLVEVVRAAAPAARFHFVEDAGHWVQYEAAGATNALLARLLA